MSAKNQVKSRYWTFVMWLDSGNMEQADNIIKTRGLQGFRSPLHDRDTWTEEDEKENPEHVAGSLKKPHYHYMTIYPNPRPMSTITNTFKEVGVQYAEPVSSIKGMWDYYTHKNNPEKFQYGGSPEALNGFVISDYIQVTKADTRMTLYMLLDYIRNNNVTTFTDLLLGLLGAPDIPEYCQMADYVQRNVLLADRLVQDRYRMDQQERQRAEARRRRTERNIIKGLKKAEEEEPDGLPF